MLTEKPAAWLRATFHRMFVSINNVVYRKGSAGELMDEYERVTGAMLAVMAWPLAAQTTGPEGDG
jgi:hypothetical protein